MVVDTKQKLYKYVKVKLGSPVINVEITDDQLDIIVGDVIQRYSAFAISGENPSILRIPTVQGAFTYQLDSRVQSVSSVYLQSYGMFSYALPGGLIVTPSEFYASAVIPGGRMDILTVGSVISRIISFNKYFTTMPDFDYNSNSKILSFFEDISIKTSHFMIETALEYEPQQVDMIYNHPWIKDMCIAKAKMQWGTNIGKMNSTLVGGATLNYERIINEGQAEYDKLQEELFSKWTKPLGIYRG